MQFIDPGEGSFDPAATSPLIEAGETPQAFDGTPCLDLAGRPRLLDADGDGLAVADLGALEHDASATLVPGEVAGLRCEPGRSMAWDAAASATSYRVRRATLPLSYAYGMVCLDTTLVTTFPTAASVPAPGQGWAYVVSAVTAGGEEGTLGFGTCVERSEVGLACP